MISVIEEELFKIIQPVIQKSENVSDLNDSRININIIVSRDKINLINNIKTLFKANISNPSLSVIFSKHISIIFSKILFKCLDDIDQNVRIASDECINLIIRLATPTFSPYISYNLFIEIKNNQSSRSLNGALHKFGGLCYLIKNSKRVSYINNVLPVLKVIVNRPEESVALTIVETLPKIAANLFPYSLDVDIEKGFLITLLVSLKTTSIVHCQRNLSAMISICCFHMRNPKIYIEKLLRYFLSINFNENNEPEIRGALFVMKSIITSCQHRDEFNLDEFVLILLRLISIFDGNFSGSIKNLSLDCLLHLLQLKKSSTVWKFLCRDTDCEGYREILANINHESIFKFDNNDDDKSIADEIESDFIEKPVETTDLILIEPDHENLIGSDLSEIEKYNGNENENNSHPINEELKEFGIYGNSSLVVDELNEESIGNSEVGQPRNQLLESDRFLAWTRDAIGYLVKMLIVEFLPDSLPDCHRAVIDWPENVKISSKVLAINCLTQICRKDYRLGLNTIPVCDATILLPPVVCNIMKFSEDEDAQLSGSAILLLAQVLSSHLGELKYGVKEDKSLGGIEIDCTKIIGIIQSQINNPTSGQHLKSVLSAVKIFLYDMISTEYGEMAVGICESVLRYTNHQYKLVRKEILLICQAIDFRNLRLFDSSKQEPSIIKKTTLAEKFINAVLVLFGDVEQDIRDDACDSLLSLIANGAFDHDKFICDCSCALYSDVTFSSLTDKSRLIPFLHRNINVSLSDVRKKLHSICNYHSTDSTVHRAVHLIIQRLLCNPIASTKEMKLSICEISGSIRALIAIHDKYPISTHSKVWLGQNIIENANLTETRTLIQYCLALLNTPLIICDLCLHTDILSLISKFIFHEGIKHLLLNDITIERTNKESGINTQLNNNLYLANAIKQFMIHLCRIMNIYWHIFQFITPSIPPHKTVLPNLSSQTHSSPGKKKTDIGPIKGVTEPQSTADYRPPRSKSSLGFFVSETNYMSIHKLFYVAYNNYLISFDASLHTDRLLNLLTQCINSLGSIFEFLTFSEVSMHIEELLSYCSIFYNVLPTQTVNLIIKLLGSIFGTNLTAQWDPFLAQLFLQLFSTEPTSDHKSDLAMNIITSWKTDCSKNGPNLQNKLKNISTSSDGNDTLQIYKWKQALSDTFLWIKSSGKRREPGILRQIASTNSMYRPSLAHYIGLFERHVFQCMRQYQLSSTDLQTAIIDLLCQLIYLRVNYCQLDSEQKFLNIIQNQLENFSAYNTDNDKDGALIIGITEFLILISYEKADGNKKDEPIINITQVIRCIESLLINGISVKPIILPCMWKIVCDLFVHRSVWLNNSGSLNLLPNANTSKEIEVQRETVVEFLLRKLIKYPETLEILSLIIEHSAREHELKWQKLSHNVWDRLVVILFEDSIEFSETAHIDHLHRLLRLMSIKVLTQSSMNKSLVDLALKFENNYFKIEDPYSSNLFQLYQLHITQAVRSVLCLQIIFIHNVDYSRNYTADKLVNDFDDENLLKQDFFRRIIEIFHTILEFYNYSINNQYLKEIIFQSYPHMAKKLIKIFLLIFINLKKIDDYSSGLNKDESNFFTGFNFAFIIEKLNTQFLRLLNSDCDLFLLWNELKLMCDISSNLDLVAGNRSRLITKDLYYGHLIQCSRHIYQMEEPSLSENIKILLSKFHRTFVTTLNNKSVSKILDIINMKEELSNYMLSIFDEFSQEIITNTSLLLKWLAMIENVHFQSSSQIILLLSEKIVCFSERFSVIVLMKVESIISARVDMILGAKFNVSSNLLVIETVKSLKTFVHRCVVPMVKLERVISNIENAYEEQITLQKNVNLIIDPLVMEKVDSGELNEKKFWKLCVEKSLINQDQDIRLGPRLLQGGTAADFEQLFRIKFESDEPRSLHVANNEIVSNLPPRFVQQCLRLGFLRSGGGIVQEGVRVDLIFRLGEKLLFEVLNCILAKIKYCLKEDSFTNLSSTIVLGLLAALNDYLSLSCQLSVPIPVSNVVSENLVSVIESLCIFLTQFNQLRSRLLIEELLGLITVCYGSSSLLTDEGMKFMGKDLTMRNVSILVDFLYSLVDQFYSNKLDGSMKYSLKINDDIQNSIRTLLMLDKILTFYYDNDIDIPDTLLQKKLQLAVISVSRLPCVIVFTRNPKNIKDISFKDMESIINNSSYKNVVEIDCLLKMNRDELGLAQTVLNSIGWTDRFMFEESWSLYLTLLHDKGPSGALNDKNETRAGLSSEELVEQGHCDSLGLLGLTDMILQTTARPNPGNPVVAQLEHKTRDKTPNLLHTKTGRKLCVIHMQLEEEIFHCHRGFKMLSAGWTITSWNLEREDSVLKYRHDQINISVLAKRISIGARSPQISGSATSNLDVLSCLQSLPILCQQWLECPNDSKRKSVALWPRACALRCAVILMDLFSSKEQIQWLLGSLLELQKSLCIEDDWITTSWICIGLCKSVAVLESSSNNVLPQTTSTGKPLSAITTNSIYGLSQSIKLIEYCLNSDFTILQQSALHSAMCLLQMTVYGKNTWELPSGSLVELRNIHEMVMRYLENQLLLIECSSLNVERRTSLSDTFNMTNSINSNSLSLAMSSGAASIASTVSGFTSINNVNTQLNIINPSYFNLNSLPRLLKSTQNAYLRTERHNYLLMATACFYCERYPDAIPESDILNSFVSLAKSIMQIDKKNEASPQLLLTMCRCLERISLTQRIGIIVTEQIIRLCGNYLRNCKSNTHSLPVLGLFITSCYLSLANSNVTTPPTANQFESVFYNGPANSNGENQLIMLERINLFWKRLTDPEIMDAVESRILCRLISNIMTDFMSGEELLNKTIHQLLRSWPRSQCVAKTLFDIITKCLNQPDGEKLIRKWTLLVLPSLTSCRPDNLSTWATTIVLIASASSSRSCLRALFSQCLDWLTRFERGEDNMYELETALCLAALAFVQDMSHDPVSENINKLTFSKAMQSGSNIPAFQKFFTVIREKHIL